MALKDRYITISQAAKEFGVTRQTISRWVSEGNISAEKIGREVLIKRTELDKYAEFQRNLPVFAWNIKEAELIARKTYDYTSEDKFELSGFEMEGKEKFGLFTFKVVRKDETEELVKVKVALEIKMSPEIKGPTWSLVPIKVWKPQSQESKPKKIRTQKGVESKAQKT